MSRSSARRGRHSAQGRRSFDEAGLRALGEQMHGSPTPPAAGHRPRRKRRWLRRTALVAAIVLVVGVGAVAGYNWYLFNRIHTVDVQGLKGSNTGAESGSENILMVGSTDRCDLAKTDPFYQDCLQGHTGINSDVIMILHLVPATKKVTLLSIPRDTFVPNARAEGANKIDAGLVEGPSQLVDSIEEDFGIPIQHYMELNFDGFSNIVQSVGGIHMYFPEPVFDHQTGLDVETPGCVYLDGADALKLVRSRDLQYKGPGVTTPDHAYWTYETQSDLARILRDHEFLRVLATTVAKQGLGNPITDERLIAASAPQVETDPDLRGQLLGLLNAFHAVSPDGVPQLTLPIQSPYTTASYVYKGGDYGEVVYPTAPSDGQVIDQFLGTSADVDTMTGQPLPPPSSVTVAVLNGTGLADQAAATGSALGALGFQVGTLSDTPRVGTPAETVVTYASPADEAAAELVAHQLSGLVIMARGQTVGGSMVTVTTGTDFAVDAPPSAGNGPSSSASTTTGSSSGASSSGASGASTSALAAPTASNPALQPWDPRSCTANGGEGP